MKIKVYVAARNREETSRLSAALWPPETGLRHTTSPLDHANSCYLATSYLISPHDWVRYCHKQRLLIFFFSKCVRSLIAFYCHFVLNLFLFYSTIYISLIYFSIFLLAVNISILRSVLTSLSANISCANEFSKRIYFLVSQPTASK